MKAKTFCPLLVVIASISRAFAADQSPSALPSKQEDRKIGQVVGEEVGRSAFDGITVAGDQALVTRNGKTEELVDELVLDDGTRVSPDGTIKTKGGREITLKQDQVLRFNGRIMVIPSEGAAVPEPPGR